MEKFKDNSGVLFKNDKKLTDNHPDYKGSIIVNNVEYWISSWIKQGKNGKFMGLAVTPKDMQPKAAPKGMEDLDSDEFF